ncbi:hypothetical protein ZIOFF_027305 [Zingiber officinale]|uniref:Uncharacterized protein n=1 Tax=Zingiber officinale TaxID=94328 RepID=A0A8J5L7U7_ZINOF|nr:hypothetical protein ZIOFF_027305 [Zingiber officinale]
MLMLCQRLGAVAYNGAVASDARNYAIYRGVIGMSFPSAKGGEGWRMSEKGIGEPRSSRGCCGSFFILGLRFDSPSLRTKRRLVEEGVLERLGKLSYSEMLLASLGSVGSKIRMGALSEFRIRSRVPSIYRGRKGWMATGGGRGRWPPDLLLLQGVSDWLLGSLYSKTSPHGDRRFKASDWAIIKEVKALVKTLPDLESPPETSYIIIETDDSMEGWGDVCKWKQSEFESRK